LSIYDEGNIRDEEETWVIKINGDSFLSSGSKTKASSNVDTLFMQLFCCSDKCVIFCSTFNFYDEGRTSSY
jgi:hypothetical protein